MSRIGWRWEKLACSWYERQLTRLPTAPINFQRRFDLPIGSLLFLASSFEIASLSSQSFHKNDPSSPETRDCHQLRLWNFRLSQNLRHPVATPSSLKRAQDIAKFLRGSCHLRKLPDNLPLSRNSRRGSCSSSKFSWKFLEFRNLRTIRCLIIFHDA